MDIPRKQARSVAVLTGAGVSAESGAPTFRGEDGLWRNYRAEDLATPGAFYRDPRLVWEWYDWRRSLIAGCRPNAAHHTLAQMERRFDDWTLITQNVDGLHQMAGSRNVVELHGNIWRMRCTRECQAPWEDRTVPLLTSSRILPTCTRCGGLARPDVVWFGESLPGDALAAALAAAQRCQVMLVVGTSTVVQPAASLPLVALRQGAYVVEINPQPTPLSDAVDEVIREPAALALPRWWQTWQRRVSVG
ncbi:MAG: NAD-dependent deacylase [Anaerolineae bacterium]|nr:NAD-dependent deacylase [Anaerolineae bacterium]